MTEFIRFEQQQLNQLYQYACALCDDGDDAYDVLQSCLEKFLRQQPSCDNPMAYLRRMMRNYFIDQYRAKQKVEFADFNEQQLFDLSATSLEDLICERDYLDKVWQQLSAQEREIIYYWAVLGYSTDELAQQLQQPRGTLLSRIHRLRKRLSQSQAISSLEGQV